MTFQVQYHLSNRLDVVMDHNQDTFSEDSLDKISLKTRSASSVDEGSTPLPIIVSKKYLLTSQWVRKFKKVQAKKSCEMKKNNFTKNIYERKVDMRSFFS